ncbi:MAG: fumarylacetoacetate hydrolase family protein [Gammaproteobacteria bacterium]
MRLVSFNGPGGRREIGAVEGEQVIELAGGESAPHDLELFIAGGKECLERARHTIEQAPDSARHRLAGLRFRPLIENAGKYLCLGLNYADHAAEGGFEKPDYPAFFMRSHTTLVGHNEPIVRPRVSEKLDYEAELAVIIGRRGRHVPESDALDYVAGYSCFNDASIRDYQRRSTQWTIGKNFDATGAFGPMLVTPDELPPGASGLRIQSRLNGEVMQDTNTSGMIFSVAKTIALLTECCTLEPGDVIAMGTPAGVGFARRPRVWMKPGDVIEVEIEGIGVLRNPIVAEAA